MLTGALLRFIAAFFALLALFFLPAGSFAYWEAWLYMFILFCPMGLVLVYFLKYEPDLLARRLQFREKVAEQALIVKLSYLPFLIAFILPGFDKRFGWSNVPAGVIIVTDILVLLSYGFLFLVFRENRFASRIIEVTRGQTVISSGPYAIVRHPMYTSVALIYLLSPLALGSYWAIIPAAAVVPILVARIIGEERMLINELEGYTEYLEKVRYRLIPGIW
jgi:protein-S-isoprenylcysteine O-methyltransferase Ste14